jgi:hypothetical protein
VLIKFINRVSDKNIVSNNGNKMFSSKGCESITGNKISFMTMTVGLFTWPRGIAVGPDNSIVVADSSNHRVQEPILINFFVVSDVRQN